MTVDSPARPHNQQRVRRVRIWFALVLVLAAVGFLLAKGLGDASIYFYPADEAVAARDQLGTDRFRLMGDVVGDTVRRSGDQVDFTVAYNGASIAVTHTGDPPELFREGIRVVLEGRFTGPAAFSSDKIMVKHSETYREKHEDRLQDDGESSGSNESDYRQGGAATSSVVESSAEG